MYDPSIEPSGASKVEQLLGENDRLQTENDELRSIIACSADLLNTWARECGVVECVSPWTGTELRNLVNRMWSYISIMKECK